MATLLLQANNTVSLGASGAVFGMFTMGVLCKFRFSFKKLLECAILGQFVVKQVIQVCLVAPLPKSLLGLCTTSSHMSAAFTLSRHANLSEPCCLFKSLPPQEHPVQPLHLQHPHTCRPNFCSSFHLKS